MCGYSLIYIYCLSAHYHATINFSSSQISFVPQTHPRSFTNKNTKTKSVPYISFRITMKLLLSVSLYIALCLACGDNGYRCVNRDGSVDDDYTATIYCCFQLEQAPCWCFRRAEDYCDVESSKIEDFKVCCEGNINFSWRHC